MADIAKCNADVPGFQGTISISYGSIRIPYAGRFEFNPGSGLGIIPPTPRNFPRFLMS